MALNFNKDTTKEIDKKEILQIKQIFFMHFKKIRLWENISTKDIKYNPISVVRRKNCLAHPM